MSQRSNRRKRRVVLGIVLLLAVLGALTGLLSRRNGGDRVNVQTEKVSRGDVVELVAATGRVQPQTEVKISANVSGRVENVGVIEGQEVEVGQLLVEIDPTRYRALVLEAEAGLRSSKAEARLAAASLEQARRDCDRLRSLHQEGLTSAGDLESAETDLEVADARREAADEAVHRAEAYLTQTRDDLSKTTITAPKGGIVTRLNVEVGEVVLGTAQNAGTILMTIADLNRMEVLAEIDESEVVKVSLGDSADIELDAMEQRVFSGIVSEIANSATTRGRGTAEEATHFEVKVALLGDVSGLRPGMTATLDVATEKRLGALHVPIQCVTLRSRTEDPEARRLPARRPGPREARADTPEAREATEVSSAASRSGPGNLREVVFLIRDGIAHEIPVETGISSPTAIELTGGSVAEGDEIVSGSYRALARDLTDGHRVRVDNSTLRRGGRGGNPGSGEANDQAGSETR